MKKLYCRPVSLTDARTGKRIRLSKFQPGTALMPVCEPLLILGYWFRQIGHLSRCTVYVPGTMPLAMRSAAEQGRTDEETWLAPVPTGVREIDVTDCRDEFQVLRPELKKAA